MEYARPRQQWLGCLPWIARFVFLCVGFLLSTPETGAKIRELQCEFQTSAFSISEKALPENPYSASYPEDFVVRNGSQLQVNGERFHFAGFNNYYLPTYAADPHFLIERTGDVDVVFRDAKKLGLTVLRTWAFADGSQWNAIQPSLGILDERVLSGGLDYVVAMACSHNMRLVLTLTNYLTAFGGMQTNAFKDYVKAILTRRNSITGVLYKDDPTIMAWDLANEPWVLGDDSGQTLTAWVKDMADFVKAVDPNHLVMVGTWGYFGASSPGLLAENPQDLSWRASDSSNNAGIWSADPVCKGEDFRALMSNTSVDIGSVHLYPEFWQVCTDDCKVSLGTVPVPVQATLTNLGYWTLCSVDCRVRFLKRWLRVHFEEGAAIGKPVIVGEFGSQRPMQTRNAIYAAVYDEILQSAMEGLPAAGSLFWILSSTVHADFDDYTIYTDASKYPPNPILNAPLPGDAPCNPPPDATDFFQSRPYLQCAANHVPLVLNASVDIFNDGWEKTLQLISEQSAALSDM
ncbi:glycoside hydrolase [Coccomyxa subellipsoidea C-169]|uniref:mannan endo-1,4-beta-mannosidase n=1 Tax=Coccomyxa subellipsoidea (strain C-169) TaxID=574566 RepID=I0YMH8_COCSC|nr:glycoside hydrolase [Coccomyxa subellipsoidea C-169]EIE19597.1 glycoside hydrolase [Coccomyxa subellipsoidea C-169]|eukprot:XP_005644141.1 glycoside hydrolase [Coccomyxa subellipsoidea C-169]